MNGIKCEKRVYTNKLNTHNHPFAQMIMPIHGKLHIETDYKNLLLDKKYLFLLPPECLHGFKADNSNEFLVLDIPEHMVNKHDMDKMQGGNKIFLDEKWKAIRYLLLNEANKKENSTSINNLFQYLYSFIPQENIFESIKYINENYTEEIDLKTLAEIEHYNITYYSEWFKKNMNVSPIEYIQNLRIKKAKELLVDTDFTVLQIAQLVGYKHNSSLTKRFKESENITPMKFRKRIRK